MGIKLSRYNLEIPDGDGVFLFNTYSGASVLLSAAQIQRIKDVVGQGDCDAGPWSEVTAFLAEKGFVVPDGRDEIAHAIDKYDAAISDVSALSLVIAPSLQCNMNCYYCYEGKDSEAALDDGDLDSLLAFISSRLKRDGTLGITWFGGEPLLSRPFIVEAARRIRNLCDNLGVRFAFRMVTNGYLLDEAAAVELAACGITSVQVTFDGPRHDHDRVRRSAVASQPRQPSFDRIVANVAAASRHLRVLVRVNVSRLNMDSIPLLLDQLRDAGLGDHISGLYFYPVFNYKASDASANYLPAEGVHFSVEDFARRERALMDLAQARGLAIFTPQVLEAGYLGCYASIANGFVIDHRGNILKCDHELGGGSSSRSSIRDFSGLDEDEDLKKWQAQRPEHNESCRDCVFLPLCFGHCPHSNLVQPDRDPVCPTYKYNWRDVFPVHLRTRLPMEERS